jgi:hypothetical protein
MNQEARVLAHLKSFKSITSMEAMRHLRIVSLHPRLTKLRRLGFRIDAVADKPGSRYLRYFLIRGPKR